MYYCNNYHVFSSNLHLVCIESTTHDYLLFPLTQVLNNFEIFEELGKYLIQG